MARRTSTPLPSHPISMAPSSDPPLFIFPQPSSRSRLTLKKKYQIELKLLTHPKQRLVCLKNCTFVPTIHCRKVSPSLTLPLSLSLSVSLWARGNVNYSCQRGHGVLHHVKVPMTLLMEPPTPPHC